MRAQDLSQSGIVIYSFQIYPQKPNGSQLLAIKILAISFFNLYSIFSPRLIKLKDFKFFTCMKIINLNNLKNSAFLLRLSFLF